MLWETPAKLCTDTSPLTPAPADPLQFDRAGGLRAKEEVGQVLRTSVTFLMSDLVLSCCKGRKWKKSNIWAPILWCCQGYATYSLMFIPYLKFIFQYSIARHFLFCLFSILCYKSILSAPYSLFSLNLYLCRRALHRLSLSSPLGTSLKSSPWEQCENINLAPGSSAQPKSLGGRRRPEATFRMCNTTFSIYTKHIHLQILTTHKLLIIYMAHITEHIHLP